MKMKQIAETDQKEPQEIFSHAFEIEHRALVATDALGCTIIAMAVETSSTQLCQKRLSNRDETF